MKTSIKLLPLLGLFLSISLWPQSALVEQIIEQLPDGTDRTILYASDSPEVFQITKRSGVKTKVTHTGSEVPFTQSISVTVSKAFSPAWSVVAVSPVIRKDIPKGHVLLVSFWVRAPEMTGGRTGILSANLEKAAPSWDSLAHATISPGTSWRQVFISAIVSKKIPSEGIHLSLHLGHQEQTIELGGLVIMDLGSDIALSDIPYNHLNWPGSEQNAPWRQEAEARIEKYRKGTLSVQVVDESHTPISNAKVQIDQIRRAVTFGSYTGFGEGLLAKNKEGELYRSFYKRLFDRATIPLYWADWGWITNKNRFIQIAEWASNEELDIRGHVLIYPGRQFMPSTTKDLSPKELQDAFLAQIQEVARTMENVPFTELDVTNELRDLTEITDLIGKEGVVEWFRQARRVFPGVKLALNENTILTEGGNTEANQEKLLEWYHYLKSNGVAPDVLGFQAHFSETLTNPETVWTILDKFARETDAELQITEFDISTVDEAAKAAYTRDFMTACFAHPRVTAFTLWGFWEGDHWKPRAASWNNDWTPKPAGLVIEDLLGKKWRTAETLATDEAGSVVTRVWLGTLKITVTHGKTTVAKTVTVTNPDDDEVYEIILQ